MPGLVELGGKSSKYPFKKNIVLKCEREEKALKRSEPGATIIVKMNCIWVLLAEKESKMSGQERWSKMKVMSVR